MTNGFDCNYISSIMYIVYKRRSGSKEGAVTLARIRDGFTEMFQKHDECILY